LSSNQNLPINLANTNKAKSFCFTYRHREGNLGKKPPGFYSKISSNYRIAFVVSKLAEHIFPSGLENSSPGGRKMGTLVYMAPPVQRTCYNRTYPFSLKESLMLIATRRVFCTVILLVTLAAPVLADNGGYASPLGEPIWGPNREQQRLSREAAVARYNYCPTGGCVVRLENVELKPATLRRGRSSDLITTYTILTPEQVAIPVTITRELYYRGKSLGKVKSVETRNLNGTFVHHLDFSLPPKAEPGLYTLVTKVSTGYGYDLKSVDFLQE
jgi:hypothetical protein